MFSVFNVNRHVQVTFSWFTGLFWLWIYKFLHSLNCLCLSSFLLVSLSRLSFRIILWFSLWILNIGCHCESRDSIYLTKGRGADCKALQVDGGSLTFFHSFHLFLSTETTFIEEIWRFSVFYSDARRNWCLEKSLWNISTSNLKKKILLE